MPDESRGFQEKGSQGQESSTVITGNGKSKIPGGNILELEDFNRNAHESTQSSDLNVSQSGLCHPEFPSSLPSGAPLTPQATDGDAVTSSSSSDRPRAENSSSSPANTCCDSDSSGGRSHDGDSGSSFCSDLCNQRLSQLDRSSFEKTNNVSSLNFSQPNLDASKVGKVHNNSDEDRVESATDWSVDGEKQGSSPPADFTHQVRETRNSIDVRWGKDVGEEEDRQSTASRRTVREGMCCCYQTFHRAFLQCVEETPAMLSGLVLSLAFCVSIIVLIPTTGRVRPVCVCVCIGVCVCNKPILSGS